MINTIIHWDCLEVMKNIPDGSIDAIITDTPYWSTKCSWDSVIPFEPMWAELKRIIKPNGAIVLFWSEPFSSALRMSNIKQYKYDLIWEKPNPSNPLLARKRFMSFHENIHIFYKKQPTYNPQKEKRLDKNKRNNSCKNISHPDIIKGVQIREMKTTSDLKHPSSVLKFNRQTGFHPTQKPVALIEYLIKTYSLEDDVILDFTSGSWTTWIAAQNTNRQFILIEKDKNYYDISLKRLQENQERLDKLSKKDII